MAKINFADFQAQDRRLCILLALDAASGYSAPHPLLMSFLESVGHRVANENLLADLDWLESKELLTLQDYPQLKVATATQRGVDVAQGRLIVDGVKRPQAGSV